MLEPDDILSSLGRPNQLQLVDDTGELTIHPVLVRRVELEEFQVEAGGDGPEALHGVHLHLVARMHDVHAAPCRSRRVPSGRSAGSIN